MIKSVIFSLSMLLLVALTDCSEPEPLMNTYRVSITNVSGNRFDLSLFQGGQEFETTNLETSESYVCEYASESFKGFLPCSNGTLIGVDSMRVEFEENIGYICTVGSNSDQFSFQGGACFFSNNSFIENELDEFDFQITPQHFLNAHSLAD